MDAVVLLGGDGTRLKPITPKIHKSLIPVGDRPLLVHICDWLLNYTPISRIIFAVSPSSDQVIDFYHKLRARTYPVFISQEFEKLGSAGAVLNADQNFGLSENFVVVNGDILTSFNIASMINAHNEDKTRLSTIAIKSARDIDQSKYGIVTLGGARLVTSFIEKPQSKIEDAYFNAGAWCFNRSALYLMKPKEMLESSVLPVIAEDRKLKAFVFWNADWHDVGTPESYREAIISRFGGNFPHIAKTAEVENPELVYQSQVGEYCQIGEGSVIARSILFNGVKVPPYTCITDSIITSGIRVPAGAFIRNKVY